MGGYLILRPPVIFGIAAAVRFAIGAGQTAAVGANFMTKGKNGNLFLILGVIMADGELTINDDNVAGDIAVAGTVLSAGYAIGKMLDEDDSCNGGLIGAGAAAVLLGGLFIGKALSDT
jgi:hypothetical protein